MAAANIIDINEDTFEFEVVNYSAEVPVVLDLWAPWCIPCRVQSRELAGGLQRDHGQDVDRLAGRGGLSGHIGAVFGDEDMVGGVQHGEQGVVAGPVPEPAGQV